MEGKQSFEAIDDLALKDKSSFEAVDAFDSLQPMIFGCGNLKQ